MRAIHKSDVMTTKTFTIGGGEWSLEVYDHSYRLLKEFVGSNGTRGEADDLYGEYNEWFNSLPEKQVFKPATNTIGEFFNGKVNFSSLNDGDKKRALGLVL